MIPASKRWMTTVAAVVLLLPVRAVSQRGQTSELAGTVKDASSAVLANVTLTVVSPQLIGGPQTVQTDNAGQYRFSSLLPGVYELTAARDGFRTVRRSAVDLPPGLWLTVDFQLDLAPLAEVVDVQAVVPTVDVHSSASPALIDRPLIENLPLNRSVTDYVNLVPGVAGFVAYGGAQRANPFSLDGTSGNDPDWGAPWASPNLHWIEQLQVVSVGANAQYGEYTGALVNAITRSGSNRFSGLADYWTTRPNWTASNRGDLPPNLSQRFRPIEVLERWDSSAQLGGPVVRDRLWFFSGFEYYKNAQRPFSFANVARTPDEPRYVTQEPKVLFKLSAAPSSRIRLEGYFEYDTSRYTGGNAGPLTRPEALNGGDNPERLGNVRLTWTPSNRALVEARYGIFRAQSTYGPASGDRSGPPGHWDQLTNVSSVNYRFFGAYEPREATAAVTVTRHIDHRAGQSHEFKAGVEHERAGLTQTSGTVGGLWYSDNNSAPDIVYIFAGDDHRTAFWRTSAFVQDTWLVNGRLTLEPGVRVGVSDGVADNVPRAQPYKTTSISPRIGAAWDVGADHRTVVRAHYGRYHDPMVTTFYDEFDYALNTAPTITAKVLGPGQFQEMSRSGGPASLAGLAIDSNVKHSYTEEYLVGVEREIWARVSVRGQYVRRSVKDAVGWIDLGSIWTPVNVIDPGPDGVEGTADDGGPLTVYNRYNAEQAFPVLTNPDNAWRTYNGLQVSATRRYAQGWELQGSYTWSRTRGSFDNDFASSAGTAQLSPNGIGVNPNWNLFRTGRTSQDRTHDVKVLGTYTLPYWGGVRLSGIYRYTSGTPWARVASFGSLTNLCCAGPRVEPASHELSATNSADLRVEKTLRVRAATTLGVYADVFNLNNQGIAGRINLTSGPNFALPVAWSDPRTLRVGARVTF